MPPRKQLIRDILIGVFSLLFITLYFFHLNLYLNGLEKPDLLMFAFGISLLISCVFEIRHYRTRENFVAILVTTILFTAGILFAESFRDYYLILLSNIDNIRGARELLGEEYLSLASNKVVGYGGAYGLGLVVSRIIGREILLRNFKAKLIIESYRNNTCSNCLQPINHR